MQVEVVSREDYLSFIEKQPLGNFMQVTLLGRSENRVEKRISWAGLTQRGKSAGCALILYGKLPGLNKYLAYLPRGPADRLGSKKHQ